MPRKRANRQKKRSKPARNRQLKPADDQLVVGSATLLLLVCVGVGCMGSGHLGDWNGRSIRCG